MSHAYNLNLSLCKQIALELQQVTSVFGLVKRRPAKIINDVSLHEDEELSKPCLLERGRIDKKIDLIHYHSSPAYGEDWKKQL
jgi:hypothetical protein